MAAEYIANTQDVNLNTPIVFNASIPCNSGYIIHDDPSGIFILRGIVNNQCAKVAQYQVTFNGNIAIPTGGTVTPIAVSITVNGEPRLASKAIITPAAVGDFGNVTSTGIIKVPRGCCFSIAIEPVAASVDSTVTPAPTITVQNGNVTISRIA